jgi:3-oxoacyl-(acyl-carrier-protein) synthase
MELQWQHHMYGAAALYASLNPGATAAQLRLRFKQRYPTSSLSGKCATGRLNVLF